MEKLVVECLRCGHQRAIAPEPRRYRGAGECPRCQYVGWAESRDLSEQARGLLRARPLDGRFSVRVV